MDVKHHLGTGAAAAAAEGSDAAHKQTVQTTLCSLENNPRVCAYRLGTW